MESESDFTIWLTLARRRDRSLLRLVRTALKTGNIAIEIVYPCMPIMWSQPARRTRLLLHLPV